MTWWDSFKDWFLNLGENYGVNPYIFGGIYVGAIPFFFLCLGLIAMEKTNKYLVFFMLLLIGYPHMVVAY